jgi:alpha-L-arabinofuranosidase
MVPLGQGWAAREAHKIDCRNNGCEHSPYVPWADAPDTIEPAPLEGVEIWGEQVRAKVLPASWNVIRLAVQNQ